MSSSIKSMIVRVIICLEIFSFMTSAMCDFRDFRDNGNKRFCGRMLTDSLALLCDGEYEAIIHPSKRSEELMDEYAYNDQPLEDLPMQYQTLPFLSKLASEVALRPRVRREWIARRGVYDECCRNPCSFNTLKSYCKRKN